VGFLFVAAVTGIGGGTLRDLLLDRGPVFWVREPLSVWLTSAAAVLVYFTVSRVGARRFLRDGSADGACGRSLG
jgi:uncharacterized membrane protein YeiH